ncbi:unnamed protein product, partial [Symbiodinium pilosum]
YAGEEGDDYLERFSRLVREDLFKSLAPLVSGVTLPWNYAFYLIAVSSFPYLADHIALWIVMARSRLSGYALLTWSLRNVADWGIVPLACMLALRVCLPLWKVGIHLRRNRFMTAVVLNFIVFWFVCAVWAPVLIVHWLTADDDLLPVAMFLVWSAVAFVLFSPMCSERIVWHSLPSSRPHHPEEEPDKENMESSDVFTVSGSEKSVWRLLSPSRPHHPEEEPDQENMEWKGEVFSV